MRHYSATLPMVSIFNTVLVGKVLAGVSDAYEAPSDRSQGVAGVLAECLEISFTDLFSYVQTARSQGLTPSETEVLDRLIDVNRAALNGMIDIREGEVNNFAFLYINLNSGKSVLWNIYLEG